jgi:alcohol dehydrogenase class IV
MQSTFIYPGSSLELCFILNQLNKNKVFLVTGKKSYIQSGAKVSVEEHLKNYDVTHFSDFQINPKWEDVIKGITLFNKNESEIILAVGGGSVIDMAKLINYYHNIDKNTINERSVINPNFSPVPYICIPTTAGSGSEATHFAVMYIGDSKFSVEHNSLVPNYVIIDPEFHCSQTPYQKAVSGIDAFSQSIESFWSILSTNESMMYSQHALKLVWENLPKVINGGDPLVHLKVAIGANFAGKAINIAKTTAPHALSYGFVKNTELPHGHSVAISLPFFIGIHCNITPENCIDIRGVSHVKQQMNKIAYILHTDMNNLEKTVIEFLDKLQLNIRFEELNISQESFNLSTQNINLERLANNPAKIRKDTIRHLYKYNQTI